MSRVAEFAVLGATGAAVVVIGRLLGSPGDVELLVDNIHVSGTAPAVRTLRSLVPMSLPSRPVPKPRSSLPAGRSRDGARVRRLSVDDARGVTIAGMASAFTVLFGAPLGSAVFALEILPAHPAPGNSDPLAGGASSITPARATNAVDVKVDSKRSSTRRRRART